MNLFLTFESVKMSLELSKKEIEIFDQAILLVKMNYKV